MKNIINWSYERASWQWDLLCVLIMIFIFSTPKAWFNKPRPETTKSVAELVVMDDCGCEVK